MVRASLSARWFVVAVVACSLVACSGRPPETRPALLRVIGDPETMSVYVNDQFVGSGRVLSQRPKSMAPGVKFVTFQAPGYFPHDLRLDLPAGETTVRIKLRQVPP